jgi:OOP family OmpA-OmpF porin
MKKLTPIQWLTALMLAAPLAGVAQRAADLRKSGDFYYNTGNYYSAASYYQQYVDGSKSAKGSEGGFRPYAVSLAKPSKSGASGASSDAEILNRLAESYRRIGDYQHAATAYELLLKSKDAAAYPEARYGYAVSLRALGRPAEAKAQLEQYQQVAGGRNTGAAAAELRSIAYAESAANSPDAKLVTVARIPEPVNSAETNYGASFANGGMIFTSTRPDSSLQKQGKNGFVNALYTSDGSGAVQQIPLAAEEGMEQGAASMSADGNHIYFTRWSYDRGSAVSSIWTSTRSGSSWSAPVKLGATVNAEGSNAKQPFITPDGRYLLFASDRSGGQGKWDIWMAPLTAAGDAGTAMNAGPSVNTSEDEESPFYHAPSQTLVFASRGHAGFGGLDLFSAAGAPGASFSAPRNLGLPVNSYKDDSYFATASPDRLLKGAVISSDRGSDGCVSLYKVDKQYRQFVAGTVTDCSNNSPLSGVRVTIGGSNGTTSDNGAYLVEVPALNAMSLAATKEGYLDGSSAVPKPERPDTDTLYNATVCLVPKPVEPPVAEAPARDNSVRFDFAKWSLRPETAVTLDTLASILKREPSLRIIVTGYTDQIGTDEYNLKLSRERADACRDYLVRKGVSPARIEVVAKGACCPLKPEKTADGADDAAARQANRRVEFDIKLNR